MVKFDTRKPDCQKTRKEDCVQEDLLDIFNARKQDCQKSCIWLVDRVVGSGVALG